MTGDRRTESVAFLKGTRQRFEFADTVLIKLPVQKRTIQISKAANTYVVLPESAPTPPPAADAATPPKPAGVVNTATTIVDTGEGKQMFGLQARHIKSTIDKQPVAGACDQTKQHIETDGWYVDTPKALTTSGPDMNPGQATGNGCNDEIKATQNGDVKLLGFPVSDSTTRAGEDGKPMVVAMEVSELEITTLDETLFDIPSGFKPAANLKDLSKAVSDANEVKLATDAARPEAAAPKAPGVVRVGVPELTNKTGQDVDTRALR